MALPHPRLTREEAVVFRQLQTNSVITPVLAKHLWPEVYVTDLCRLCGKERATLAHILEDCECANADNSADVLPPPMEEAKRSEDYDVQHTAIQQILAALEKQRPDGMEAERVNPKVPQPASSPGIFARQSTRFLRRLTLASGQRNHSQKEELTSAPRFDVTRHLRLADLANAFAYRRRLGSKAKEVQLRVGGFGTFLGRR
ncbi:hypothetical protein HPB47_007862, partial [Ixodes persulcatus]